MIKFEIKPDTEQQNLIEREIKYSRYVYNYFVKKRYEIWSKSKKNVSFDEEREMLRKLKGKQGWLKCVESAALEQAIRDLDADYYKFFKLNGNYPKFRTKEDKEPWYKTRNVNNQIRVYDKQKLMTLPTLGVVKIETDKKILGKITHVQITKKEDNKYEARVTIQR